MNMDKFIVSTFFFIYVISIGWKINVEYANLGGFFDTQLNYLIPLALGRHNGYGFSKHILFFYGHRYSYNVRNLL